MTLIAPPFAPYLASRNRAFSNVQPYTYEDGLTGFELIEKLDTYVRDILIPWINTEIPEFADGVIADVNSIVANLKAEVDTDITNLTNYVDTAVQQIINDSIEVQDPVVANLVTDSSSQTRSAVDNVLSNTLTTDPLNTSSEGYLSFSGTEPGNAAVVKQPGDGRAGVWEFVNNATNGYTFHLVGGPDWGGQAGMLGIGTNPDHTNGRAVVMSNKGSGTTMLYIDNQDTVGAGGRGIEGVHSGGGTFAEFTATSTAGGPLLRLADPSGALAAAGVGLQSWITSDGLVGAVGGDGYLRWRKDIQAWAATGPAPRVVASSSEATLENTHQVILDGDVQGVQIFRRTGSLGEFWESRIHSPSPQVLALDVAFDAGPQGTTTLNRAFTAQAINGGVRLGFFGGGPVDKPTGVAVTAEGIHAALVSLGLIGA